MRCSSSPVTGSTSPPGLTVEESVGRAVATAGRAVVVAGGTVVIAILGLAVSGVPFLTAGGIAVSVVVLIMVLASVTLLPAFLGLAGHWINRLGLPGRRTPDAGPRDSALGAMGQARLRSRGGVRRRHHRAAPGPGGTAAGTPGRHARRRSPPPAPDRAPGLRPRGRGLRARGQRSAGRRRRHLAGRERGGPDRRGAQGRRGSREGRRPSRRTSSPESRRCSSSRPPAPRTTRRPRPSSGCAPTYSRPLSATALHVPTSADRRRSSPTSEAGSPTGCRTSSAP